MFGYTVNNSDYSFEMYLQLIIQSDSQLVVNSVNGKIEIPKDVMNLVEIVKCLLARLMKVEWNIITELSTEMLMVQLKNGHLFCNFPIVPYIL